MKRMTTLRHAPLIAMGWMILTVANAGEVPAPRVAITKHEGTFNGEKIKYTATVAEVMLDDADGKPAAAATTIAYIRDGVKDRSKRPVMFLFNGGPGASSSPLHMSALGPYLRKAAKLGDRSAGTWAKNPLSPLDVADLVFIDPVGMGFSRPLAGNDGTAFYSVSGDAQSVKKVIDVACEKQA